MPFSRCGLSIVKFGICIETGFDLGFYVAPIDDIIVLAVIVSCTIK